MTISSLYGLGCATMRKGSERDLREGRGLQRLCLLRIHISRVSFGGVLLGRFLGVSRPEPITLPSIETTTVKIGSWSGPSPMSRRKPELLEPWTG